MEFLSILTNWASTYTALVNLLLTTFIVLFTAWYAVVTRRMWKEMVDSRLSGIRPLLDIVLDSPELENIEDQRTLKNNLKLYNFGRGPAYAIRGAVSLRYEAPEDKTWIETDPKLPSIIRHGEEFDSCFEIPAFPTQMDLSRKEFLMILINYQDGEGNYYSLKKTYDLRADSLGIMTRIWQLRLEELRFRKFSRRRRPNSDFLHVEHDAMKTVSSYSLPRALDWSK